MPTAPFDRTQLETALGAYFREHTAEVVRERIYQPGALDSTRPNLWDIVDRQSIWDEKAWGEANFDINVQDRANAFAAQGNVVNFNGRLMKLHHMRADFELEWLNIYGSFLNHIAQQSYVDTRNLVGWTAAMHAFSEFLFEGIIEKFFERFWLQTSMKGQYSSGFNYVASFASAADGWLQIIADAVTNTLIPAAQIVAAGAATLDGTNTYAHWEAMGKAQPAKLDGVNTFLLGAVENTDFYNDGFQAAHPGANERIHSEFQRRRLKNREQTAIIPTREMDGTDTTIITPANNLIFATNFDSQPPQIFTSPSADPLKINVTMLYSAEFAIKRYDELVINDL